MFKFDAADIQRLTVSAVGALLLSAACIVGAVGPARAADIRPAADRAVVAGGSSQPAAR